MRAEAYDPRVIARSILLACAAAAIVALATQLRSQDRCDAASTALFAFAVHGTAPAGGPAAALGRVRSSCRGGDALAAASGALGVAKRPALALAAARESVRREPQGFAGWVALSDALRRSDPAGAARAVARAKALNPRWRGPGAPR